MRMRDLGRVIAKNLYLYTLPMCDDFKEKYWEANGYVGYWHRAYGPAVHTKIHTLWYFFNKYVEVETWCEDRGLDPLDLSDDDLMVLWGEFL